MQDKCCLAWSPPANQQSVSADGDLMRNTCWVFHIQFPSKCCLQRGGGFISTVMLSHALPRPPPPLPPTCTDVKAADNLGTEVAINKGPLFFTRFLHSAVDVLGQIKTDVQRPSLFHLPSLFFSQVHFSCLGFFSPPAAAGQIDPVVLLHRHRFVCSKCQTSAFSPEAHEPNILQNLNQDSHSLFPTSCSRALLWSGPV